MNREEVEAALRSLILKGLVEQVGVNDNGEPLWQATIQGRLMLAEELEKEA